MLFIYGAENVRVVPHILICVHIEETKTSPQHELIYLTARKRAVSSLNPTIKGKVYVRAHAFWIFFY